MNIYILSRFRIEAFENANMSDFVADDLVRAIRDRHSKIIIDDDIVEDVQRRNPELRYHYKVIVKRI